MNQDMPPWAKTFAARFLGSRDFDFETWRQVFDADLRDWTGAEMIACMAWMQSEGQRWTPKTARDLCMALRTFRKQSREPGAVDGEKCAACRGTGWVTVYPDKPAAFPWVEKLRAYSCAAPCACSKGRKILDGDRHYRDLTGAQREDTERLGRLGVSQQAAHRAENATETTRGEAP